MCLIGSNFINKPLVCINKLIVQISSEGNQLLQCAIKVKHHCVHDNTCINTSVHAVTPIAWLVSIRDKNHKKNVTDCRLAGLPLVATETAHAATHEDTNDHQETNNANWKAYGQMESVCVCVCVCVHVCVCVQGKAFSVGRSRYMIQYAMVNSWTISQPGTLHITDDKILSSILHLVHGMEGLWVTHRTRTWLT